MLAARLSKALPAWETRLRQHHAGATRCTPPGEREHGRPPGRGGAPVARLCAAWHGRSRRCPDCVRGHTQHSQMHAQDRAQGVEQVFKEELSAEVPGDLQHVGLHDLLHELRQLVPEADYR